MKRNHRTGESDQAIYASQLSKFREGHVDESLIELLRKRVVGKEKVMEMERKGEWVMTAVLTNAERRDALKRKTMIDCLKAKMNRGSRVYRLAAEITKTNDNGYSEEVTREFIQGFQDYDCERLHPLLDISVGMRVLVSKNFKGGISFGIANGTLAEVVGFAWPDGSILDESSVPGHFAPYSKNIDPDVQVFIPTQPPSHVLIKPLLKESLEMLQTVGGASPFKNLRPDVFPLPRISKTVAPRNSMTGASLSAEMEQFPLTRADVLTVHKLQGQTLTCPLYLPSWNRMTHQAAYVTISRQRRLENLYFGEELKWERAKKWKLKPILRKELDWLEMRSQELVSSLKRP